MPHVLLSNPAELMVALAPELILMVGAAFLMLWAAWRPDSASHQRSVGIGSLVVVALTTVAVLVYMKSGPSVSSGVIASDRYRWSVDLIVLFAAGATIALSIEYNARERILAAESHVLVLFATSGMMLLAAARDLIIVFLGVELMSISTYVLAGMNRRSARAAEAALKYFLLGAFSTAFLLYGIALVYGATGSTNLQVIGDRVVRLGLATSPILLIGIAMLLIGFGFKVAAAPFHMWAPDVYEGAPTPMTAFMASGVKAAAFGAFLRVWFEAFGGAAVYAQWHLAVWWLAAVTMVVGNVIALAQRNIKRLLAYSSIAHAGYLLVAFAAGAGGGYQGISGGGAIVFYLVAYTLATMGAFALIVALTTAGEPNLNVEDLSGLWTVRPMLALAMGVCMLSFLGFPIFGGMGFFAKYYILLNALWGGPAHQSILAVVLVLTSVLGAGYYLWVVMVMFMRPRPEGAPPVARVGGLTGTVIGVSVALILLFGVAPGLVLDRLAGAVPGQLPRFIGPPVASPVNGEPVALAPVPGADRSAVPSGR